MRMDNRRELLETMRNDVQPVRHAARKVSSRSNIGNKLITGGLILTFGTPDPFTDIVGWPMLVVGLVAKKYLSHVGVKDAFEEANGLLKELARAKYS